MESNGHKHLGPSCSRERAVGVPFTCLIQKEDGPHIWTMLSLHIPFPEVGTVSDTGGPMAVPKMVVELACLCQVNCTYRQNLRKLTNCSIESAIHSASEESKLSFSQATLTAKSAGTFVNRDTASSSTSVVSFGRV